jgi:hypothetical protein
VDPVPESLLPRISGSAGNRTRDLWDCSQELWSLHHRTPRHKNSKFLEIKLSSRNTDLHALYTCLVLKSPLITLIIKKSDLLRYHDLCPVEYQPTFQMSIRETTRNRICNVHPYCCWLLIAVPMKHQLTFSDEAVAGLSCKTWLFRVLERT